MFRGRSSDLQDQTYSPDFPNPFGFSVLLAFVPAYRCGAVPDFHRIPFSLFGEETSEWIHYTLWVPGPQARMLWISGSNHGGRHGVHISMHLADT